MAFAPIVELTAQRNTNGGGASTSVTFTFPSAPLQGNLVVLGFSWRGDTTVSAVPHSVSLATNGGNGSGIDSAIYYKIADGTEGVTWTFTLAASNKSAGVASEWRGIANTSPLDKVNSNTGTGTAGTTGLTGTLTQTNELVVALYGNININTWASHDNGQAEIGEAVSTGGSGTTKNNTSVATVAVTATTSVNYGATLSGSQIWSSAVATFKAATTLVPAPGAGSAAFTGQAPTVSLLAPKTLTPDVGVANLTGQTPTRVEHSIRQPGAGALAATGQQPAAKQQTFVNPGAGSAAFTGQAPDRFVSRIVPVDAGAANLTGQTPTRVEASIRAPGAGSAAFTGQAPITSRSIFTNPDVGAAAFTGYAPDRTVSRLVPVPAGEANLTGQTPTRVEASLRAPGAGAIAFTGYAPTPNSSVLSLPGVGAINITGHTPTRVEASIRTPGTGAINITGQQPTRLVQATAQPGAGAIAFTGQQPTLLAQQDITIAVPAGSLSLTGRASDTVATGTTRRSRRNILKPIREGLITVEGYGNTLSYGKVTVSSYAPEFKGLAPIVGYRMGLSTSATVVTGITTAFARSKYALRSRPGHVSVLGKAAVAVDSGTAMQMQAGTAIASVRVQIRQYESLYASVGAVRAFGVTNPDPMEVIRSIRQLRQSRRTRKAA